MEINEFMVNELKGRKLFKALCDDVNIPVEFTKDMNSRIDGYVYKDIPIEIKVRSHKYLSFPTHYMELDKFNAMQDINSNGFYVNFFGKGYCIIYSLIDIRKFVPLIDIKTDKCTSKKSKKVVKRMFDIPADLGTRYFFNGTNWKEVK